MNGEVKTRRRSKVEAYAHLVWATRGRFAHLSAEYEPLVHRCIISESEKLGCVVLASGGMPDHVHLLVRIPATVCASVLMRRVKGCSSALMNDIRPRFSEHFRWEQGYVCFSIGRSQVDTVRAYILEQKFRHSANRVWPEWEETDEEAT